MNQDSSPCPAEVEEIAENYVMGTLPGPEKVAFEEHYVGCNRCAKVLQHAAEYVETMRRAAKTVREGGRER